MSVAERDYLLVAFLVGLTARGVCFTSPWRNDVFNIDVEAPPAALLVYSADGKRVGADPSKPISSIGMGTTLNEFPLAHVTQQNTFTDDFDGTRTPAPQTTWMVSIMDESPATYTAQLRGLTIGVANLHVSLIITPRPDSPRRTYLDLEVLMSPGIVKEFRLSSDRNLKPVSILRIVKPGDLRQSVDSACKLGLISPEGICQSLLAKAGAAAASVDRGRLNAARGQIQAFQAELIAQAGQHIKEPALTILREEAEALLNPPPPMPKIKQKRVVKSKK